MVVGDDVVKSEGVDSVVQRQRLVKESSKPKLKEKDLEIADPGGEFTEDSSSESAEEKPPSEDEDADVEDEEDDSQEDGCGEEGGEEEFPRETDEVVEASDEEAKEPEAPVSPAPPPQRIQQAVPAQQPRSQQSPSPAPFRQIARKSGGKQKSECWVAAPIGSLKLSPEKPPPAVVVNSEVDESAVEKMTLNDLQCKFQDLPGILDDDVDFFNAKLLFRGLIAALLKDFTVHILLTIGSG